MSNKLNPTELRRLRSYLRSIEETAGNAIGLDANDNASDFIGGRSDLFDLMDDIEGDIAQVRRILEGK